MLPLNLLRLRFSKGQVRPRYIDAAEAEILPEVISIFRQSIGKRFGEVNALIEDLGGDPRLLRGLMYVLRNRLTLEDVNEAVLIKARLDAFREAAKFYPINAEKRDDVLGRVASRIGMSKQELDDAFLKIYDDEKRIIDFREPSPDELRREYNLSLMQTMLFKAIDIDIEVRMSGSQTKAFLRRAKLMGLMYIAESVVGGIRMRIDGPVSILKQTDRYGTRLAKLVPMLIGAEWKLLARVKIGEGTHIYEESSDEVDFPSSTPQEEVSFDSFLEADFYRRLSSICGQVEREPEALIAGSRIIIPDFRVGDAYIELVGYWSPQYIERKYEKLVKLNIPIIVLVNEKLATSTWKTLPHFVVTYRDRPRVTDIYKLIKPYCKKS